MKLRIKNNKKKGKFTVKKTSKATKPIHAITCDGCGRSNLTTNKYKIGRLCRRCYLKSLPRETCPKCGKNEPLVYMSGDLHICRKCYIAKIYVPTMIKCPKCGDMMQVKSEERGLCAKCYYKERILKNQQRRKTITYMFEQLKDLKFIRPKQMEVIQLISEDLSFKEIAEKLKVSRQAIDNLLDTALNNTQELLETIKDILHQNVTAFRSNQTSK
jgi:predicted DNA-binding protein YlxM (UPF0122 family)